MKLIDISRGNLMRRPGRAAAIVFGLMVAVMAATALFSLTSGLALKVRQEIEAAGTKVLILPKADKVSFSYGGMAVATGVTFNFKPLPLNTVEKIRALIPSEEIVAVSKVELSAITIEDKKYLLVGQDFNLIPKTKPWWKIDGAYPRQNNEVLLGNSIAKRLSLNVGSEIKAGERNFRVTGILNETGAQEDGMIFTVNNPSVVPSLVELILKDNEQFEEEVQKLQAGMPFAKVSAVRDATEAKEQALDQYRRFSITIAIMMALVAILIVTSGFSAAASERAKEIGIFRAMGFHIKHIIAIFLYEAAILAGIGSLVGLISGQLISLMLAEKIAGGTAAFLPWYAYVGVFAISILLAGTSAYLPAKKAAMIDPAEALRYL